MKKRRPKLHLDIREIARPSLIYRVIRERLDVSQEVMAGILGCSRRALSHREHNKRQFYLDELVELRTISQLNWQEFGELIEELVKMK